MFASARRSSTAAKLDAIERSQALVAFDLDGLLIEANENFLRLMGYDLAEVRGRHHRLFVDRCEAAEPAYEAFWNTLRRGEIHSAEFRRLAKGGREVWIRATYNPVFDARGRPIRIVKVALDITAEKQAATDAAGQITAINRSQAVIHFAPTGPSSTPTATSSRRWATASTRSSAATTGCSSPPSGSAAEPGHPPPGGSPDASVVRARWCARTATRSGCAS